MRSRTSSWIRRGAVASLLALLLACSSSDKPAEPAVAPSAAAGTAPRTAATACSMLGAETMSAIMGETLTAEPRDGRLATQNHTECHYFGTDHTRFRIMVSIQRSNVAAMVNGLKIPAHGTASESNPYADLGDGAKGIGPMVYIRAGSDLIGISSRSAFMDNPDIARRHRIASAILQAIASAQAAAHR